MSFKGVLFLIIWTLFSGYSAYSQQLCDRLLPFSKHLYTLNSYHEIIELDRFCPFNQQEPAMSDSLNYLLGNAFLKLHQADSALSHFVKLGDEGFYNRGIRLGLNNFLDRRAYQRSVKWLESGSFDVLNTPDVAFYSGGIYLLSHDLDAFDSLLLEAPAISLDNTKVLNSFRQRYSETKKRSPWVAGMLSVVVPGLGKVYAGKPRQGLSVFFTIGLFALQSWEAYHRQGLKSPSMYITGAVALGYYFSDIWGSAMAVKIKNEEDLYEIDQDLHSRLYFSL